MRMLLVAVEGHAQVLGTGLAGYELEDGKEILLQIEVEVGLEVAEPDWGLEGHALARTDVLKVLDTDVGVEVRYDVREVGLEDFFEVGLDFGLEVVEAVEECSDVTLEWPTCA